MIPLPSPLGLGGGSFINDYNSEDNNTSSGINLNLYGYEFDYDDGEYINDSSMMLQLHESRETDNTDAVKFSK